MTEISSPIISGRNPAVDGSCGKKRDGVEVRIVDENDLEVLTGVVGELVVRTDRPWAMNHGYYKNSLSAASAAVSDIRHFCARQPDACAAGSEAIAQFV
jgi:carnitine-CoA ligase